MYNYLFYVNILDKYRSYVAHSAQINSVFRRNATCHFSIGLDMWKNLRGTKINYKSALKVPNLLPGYGIPLTIILWRDA
jgi:hypothetical protein